MIKNKKQESLTKERLAELTQLRDKASKNVEISDIEKSYTLNSFDGMIATLQEELDEYIALKQGNLKILEAKALEDLPILLIKARIAVNMSQTRLATELNIQPQQIQRYEANDYQSVSFDRLLQIAQILGVCVRFENTVIIGTGPKFETPENVTEADIIKAEKFVKEKRSLVIS